MKNLRMAVGKVLWSVVVSVVMMALIQFLSIRKAYSAISAQENSAIRIVESALGDNDLGVKASDLYAKPNPKGKGAFVYVKNTRFSGIERKLICIVLDGKAYSLNGATKNITATLAWPRDADESKWKTTGLNPYMPDEALKIVFGD